MDEGRIGFEDEGREGRFEVLDVFCSDLDVYGISFSLSEFQ